jgi:hypothetical protein
VERLLAWYRVSSSVGAVIALVLANLVPLAGVLWFGWSIWTVLTIYWVENGIVGFYNVLKLAAVSGLGKIAVIPFFIIHYGMFWLVHGIFVLSLPTFVPFGAGDLGGQPIEPPFLSDGGFSPDDSFPPDGGPGPGGVAFDTAPVGANMTTVIAAGIGLFISHGVSYVLNFIRSGEYRRATATELMSAPYRRVVILHLSILFGAFAVVLIGAQLGPLLVLITLKTGVDLAFHLREHQGGLPSGTVTQAP